MVCTFELIFLVCNKVFYYGKIDGNIIAKIVLTRGILWNKISYFKTIFSLYVFIIVLQS